MEKVQWTWGWGRFSWCRMYVCSIGRSKRLFFAASASFRVRQSLPILNVTTNLCDDSRIAYERPQHHIFSSALEYNWNRKSTFLLFQIANSIGIGFSQFCTILYFRWSYEINTKKYKKKKNKLKYSIYWKKIKN